MIWVITGLPGTGKTTVATALAARTGAFVLHTDLLKVTLRHQGVPLKGPAWQGDLAAKLAAVRPVLERHVQKARNDGYDLVIEGTLAIGLSADERVCLQLTDEGRRDRIAQKHPSAQQALREADLSALTEALRAEVEAGARAVDAAGTVPQVVERVLR